MRAVVVIGAGPAGLAAAACLRRQGIAPLFIDAEGALGGAYRRIYPQMRRIARRLRAARGPT